MVLKKKVMDDLDALLADLQNTTSNISNFQQQQHQAPPSSSTVTTSNNYTSSQQNNFGGSQDSLDAEPPPVPPPPSQEVLDAVAREDNMEQPLYEPQMIQPQPMMSHSSQPASPPSKPAGSKSSLSNNLSELDSLLQDLNSAQFMAEVDRRNAVNQQQRQQGVPAHVPPPSSYRPEVHEPRLETHGPAAASVERPHVHPAAQTHHVQQNTYTVVNNPNQPRVATSSATRELDELMESLSSFKMNQGGPKPHEPVNEPPYAKPNKPSEPPYAKPNKPNKVPSSVPPPTQPKPQKGKSSTPGPDQLDAMLGHLQSDMNRQGVSTAAKGMCAACNKPIVGQVITALARIWHPEHFTCAHCHEALGTQNFFERDQQPYCEKDYHNLFSPRCAYCNGPILDKCVTALDRAWHPEHFFCAQCGRQFDDEGFHERDGKAYCREDYFDMFAPKCGGCNRPIMDNYISALNRQWHPECFVCRDCHAPFGGGSFFDHEGMPYCETHYHAKRGSLCAGCQKPITGRCITAMYKKFHPEHFVCAFCLKQLNKGTFKEQNDKPYCHACFVKLFG